MKNPINQQQTTKTNKKTRRYGFKAIALTAGCLSLLAAGSSMIYAAPQLSAHIVSQRVMSQPIPVQVISASSEGASAVNESKVVNQTITVNANQDFTIKLQENASTGYTWSYKADPHIHFVKSTETSSVPASVDKQNIPIVGAPNDKTLTFKATKPGTYQLTFKYERAWEKDATSAETVVYTVHVK
ncbi:protease inhibitor I42 family protein [Paenibacillus hunanensis]|uniref:protease inhibitor I42 family protein n=1 Tax=Paenibacillus hunanensis TaxID=539262 RepID=UPI002A6A1B4C|nr:protease inhibitor I42 family protein [Paenibacillus hunanensis]WPP39682.1 protease inhibitor I42 family protein [Paenibacillus hunanensis]